MRFPLLAKTAAIGGVLLALMFALQSVTGIVAEREGRLREAERGVADSLATQQVLLGPVLRRACVERWTSLQGEGKERKALEQRREFTLAATPASLDVAARAVIEPRHRGIFRVNGYTVHATLRARWANLAALQPQPEHAGSATACEVPELFVAVGDARGIRNVGISVAGHALAPLPGTGHASHPRGFHAVIGVAQEAGQPLDADVTLDLAGTGALSFAPVGDATTASLSSDWPHPSFAGRFLPDERTVTDTGFNATWRLSALATSAARELLNGGPVCGLEPDAPAAASPNARHAACIETFGVGFIDPVSGYVLSDRATKYGLLFIALTFVGVGLVEVLKRLRVHPVQYLLVGSALALFFLLLVSLTEHIAFAAAYLCAASACTLLLTFYASFVLGGARTGVAFGAAMSALYGALYLLLQLEQSALVLGAVLLFVVLAAVMVTTRRVDWYTLIERLRRDAVLAAGKPTQ